MRRAPEKEWIEFRPRTSYGRYWVAGTGALVLAFSVGPFILTWSDVPLVMVIVFALLGLAISGPLFVVSWYYPQMRYWLGPTELVLSYGPLMNDRIPLDSLKSVRRRNLRMSLQVSFRFPGLALFYGHYLGVNRVRMCSTSATRRILLLDDGRVRYGVTPEYEFDFVDALVERASEDIQVSENFNPARRETKARL